MTVSLRAKLIIAVIGPIVLALLLLVSMAKVVRSLADAMDGVVHVSSSGALADALQRELSQVLVPLNDYVLTGDVSNRDKFDHTIVQASKVLTELQERAIDVEWIAVTQDLHDRVLKLATRAVDVLFTDHPVGNREVVGMMGEITLASNELIKRADRFHQLVQADIAKREKIAGQMSGKAGQFVGWLLIAVPVLAIGVIIYVSRSVTRPLAALHRGVADLSAGRTAQIPVQAQDEIGEVARAFNTLADNLGASRDQVRQHTKQLEALYGASRALSQESSRDVLYQTLINIARTLTDAHYAAFVIFNSDEMVIQVVESGTPPWSEQGQIDAGVVLARFPRGSRPLRLDGADVVLGSKIPVCNPPLNTLLVVPIEGESGIRQYLYLLQKETGAFTSEDANLVGTITQDAAQSLKVIRQHEKTERLAMFDSLTGFHSRWAFDDRLAEEFSKVARHPRPFSLIFLDLDHFKGINDRFGHATGDEAIRLFCGAIKKSIRSHDIAGRYGGDEVLLFLPETDLHAAHIVAQRILDTVLGLSLIVDGESITFTASLGIAAYPEHGQDKEALFRSADYALYQAKANGRSRVETFQPQEPVPSSQA